MAIVNGVWYKDEEINSKLFKGYHIFKLITKLLEHLIDILSSSCKKGKLSGKSGDCDMDTISLQPRFWKEQLGKVISSWSFKSGMCS